MITDKTYNPKLHVAEYKRTCKECGKVWHSLIEREKQINPNKFCDEDNCGQFSGGCCGGPNAASAQYRKNVQDRENSLQNLQRCPQCNSSHHTTTIVYYEKQI